MPPLYGAVSSKEGNGVAILISNDLNLNMAGTVSVCTSVCVRVCAVCVCVCVCVGVCVCSM